MLPGRRQTCICKLWPMSVVAKWSPISATAEHLLLYCTLVQMSYVVNSTYLLNCVLPVPVSLLHYFIWVMLHLQVKQKCDSISSVEHHSKCRDVTQDLGPRQSSCRISWRIYSIKVLILPSLNWLNIKLCILMSGIKEGEVWMLVFCGHGASCFSVCQFCHVYCIAKCCASVVVGLVIKWSLIDSWLFHFHIATMGKSFIQLCLDLQAVLSGTGLKLVMLCRQADRHLFNGLFSGTPWVSRHQKG